ncbi:hypothetical protein GCM10009789_39090 [Kribbella sancticallisti]|uniref:Uncharacterized protein n=1 Tax=Kribbella sancticallisti TaxID=460087 RepID=A0ABN2DQR7_9ACTN
MRLFRALSAALRNLHDTAQALREMLRVTKPGIPRLDRVLKKIAEQGGDLIRVHNRCIHRGPCRLWIL